MFKHMNICVCVYIVGGNDLEMVAKTETGNIKVTDRCSVSGKIKI